MRDMLCELFESEEGLELCEQAVDGLDAIEKAERCRPDLIVMDFSMPVMNGLEAARILKAVMPAVPIILFTMHAQELFSSGTAGSGVDAIISKGDMNHLVDRTRMLLTASA